MPSQGSQRSVEAARSSASRTKRSGTKKQADGSVRVWGEVGLTISVTREPPQFVKVLFGHERIAPDGSLATLERTTKLIDEYNETIVEKQVRKYTRLVEAGGVRKKRSRS